MANCLNYGIHCSKSGLEFAPPNSEFSVIACTSQSECGERKNSCLLQGSKVLLAQWFPAWAVATLGSHISKILSPQGRWRLLDACKQWHLSLSGSFGFCNFRVLPAASGNNREVRKGFVGLLTSLQSVAAGRTLNLQMPSPVGPPRVPNPVLKGRKVGNQCQHESLILCSVFVCISYLLIVCC